MVWGMGLPSGFGEFWPEGDFEGQIGGGPEDGWMRRLTAYFKAQPIEVQKELFDWVNHGSGSAAHEYPAYVYSKFRSEAGTRENIHSPPYNSIKAHEAPLSFDVERGGKLLGSLIKLNGRIMAVDDTLKAIIERLEPDVHQFFPLEIKLRKGKVYPKPYYIIVIGTYFDSFSPEKSENFSYHDYGQTYQNSYRFE